MCDTKCASGTCVPALVCKVLLVVGGINWGLIGIGIFLSSDWNLVKIILGSIPTLEAIAYILVGAAAIMSIFGCKCNKCKTCDDCSSCSSCDTNEPKM